MSPLAALARRLGHRAWFGAVVRPLVPADRFLGRLTRGRVVALGIAPSLVLTTTGRRTGRARSNPLLYVPDGDGYAVVGSNWGQSGPPAWSLNLLADPHATVAVRGRVIAVRARLITGPDRERLWRLLVRQWPPYETYAKRVGERDIPLFLLEPVDQPAGPG